MKENEKQKEQYRSGVIGKAIATFGGAIQIGIHGWKDKHGSDDVEKVALSLSEIKKALNVGDRIPDDAELYPPQIWMVFNNMTSIDMMRNALDCLEHFLKTGEFPDDFTSYPRGTTTTTEPPSE